MKRKIHCCPVCGNDMINLIKGLNNKYIIYCRNCGCGTNMHLTKFCAIREWNKYKRNGDVNNYENT